MKPCAPIHTATGEIRNTTAIFLTYSGHQKHSASSLFLTQNTYKHLECQKYQGHLLAERLWCWCAMSNIELCTTFLNAYSFNSSKYKLLRREKSKQGSFANFAYNTRYPRSSPFNSTSRARGYFHISTDFSVVHKKLRRIFPYTTIIRKDLKCTGNTTEKKTSNASNACNNGKILGWQDFRIGTKFSIPPLSIYHSKQQKKLPFDQLQTRHSNPSQNLSSTCQQSLPMLSIKEDHKLHGETLNSKNKTSRKIRSKKRKESKRKSK